jgi:hypothetical protein
MTKTAPASLSSYLSAWTPSREVRQSDSDEFLAKDRSRKGCVIQSLVGPAVCRLSHGPATSCPVRSLEVRGVVSSRGGRRPDYCYATPRRVSSACHSPAQAMWKR